MHGKYLKKVIGPRLPLGRYHSWYWGEDYTVLDINIDHETGNWLITVATDAELRAGRSRTHATAWDWGHDKVVRDPAENLDYRFAHADEIEKFWLEYVRGMHEAGEIPTADDFAAMMAEMHGVALR